MKEILVVGMSNNIGGTEMYFHNYYECFDLKKYHFDFVTPWGTVAFADEYRKNGSKIFVVPNFMKNPIGYYKKMRKIIRDGNYDIVHINMLSAANVLPVKAALKEKVPKIIVHSHNTNMPKGFVRKALHNMNKRILAKPELTRLACGKSAGKWLFGDSVNFYLLNNALDIKKYKFDAKCRAKIRKKYGISKNDFLLGNIGRISEQKNQIFLVNIFQNIKKNTKLMIVGGGDQIELKNKVKNAGLEKKIIIVPAVKNINEYYSAFDAFVLPSKFEGMPVVLAEAQANGLNSLISDRIMDFPSTRNIKILDLKRPVDWLEEINRMSKIGTLSTSRKSVLPNDFDIKLVYKKLINIYNYDGVKK